MSQEVRLLNSEPALVKIRDLVEHPANPNQGDIGKIIESIRTHGFYGYIIVSKRTNRVLAGNHRFRAMMQLGRATIPAVFVDVDEEGERRILLTDNRLTRLGHDDPQAVVDILMTLADTVDGFTGTGYDGDDVDDLLKQLGLMPSPTVAVPSVKGSSGTIFFHFSDGEQAEKVKTELMRRGGHETKEECLLAVLEITAE